MKEVEMAVCEWLQMQDRIFKLMSRWDKCISVLRDYAEK
jgi:hypothetical protein